MNEETETVVAKVGGRTVSVREVLRGLRLDGRMARLIRDAVEQAALRNLANESKTSATDAEVQEAADGIRETLGLFEAQETATWLKINGLTVEDLQAEAEVAVLKGKLQDAIPLAEVRRHFAENRRRFESARLSLIACSRKDLAEEIRAQVTEEGADFSMLARRHSEDRKTAEAAGYLGWVSHDDLDTEADAKVFTARAGACLGPFADDKRWLLFYVHERREPVLDKATERVIRSTLLAGMVRKATEAVEISGFPGSERLTPEEARKLLEP